MLKHTHTYIHAQNFYKLSMLEKNVNLNAHEMSCNSRSKLNFAQCFKQIHTHTHTHTHTKLECTLKKKKFKIIPRGLSSGMVDDASVLL
jgi:hypothetical protein